MVDDDTMAATAQGLARCLRMLTEEAASLNLLGTFAALQDALTTCQSEMTTADAVSYGAGRAGLVLH